MLAHDPRVRCLAFTGSRAAGQAVAASAAAGLKALQLECGSNNPAIVRADADIPATAQALTAGFTKLNGQWCESPGAVFVAASQHDQLLDAILEELRQLRCGPCLDPQTTFGPQANAQQRDTVLAATTRLRTHGASIHTAAAATPGTGYYLPPAVVTEASPQDTLEEIFGPVLCLHPVQDDREALALANAAHGGLAAYIFTTDETAARNLGKRLVAGEIKINGTSLLDLHPRSAQSFWNGSGIGGHGNADLLGFFLGTRIIGPDLPDAPL
jgi:phenylacetaldehyde dehydrogenase